MDLAFVALATLLADAKGQFLTRARPLLRAQLPLQLREG
jgi:type IV secretory pathway ATPase VirB11/archaellum biosynthesis ATPase